MATKDDRELNKFKKDSGGALVRGANGETYLNTFAPANFDAFGRLRVSNLTTLFDSKQLHDSQPLFWDDQQTGGGGTATQYRSNEASTRISVSNLTAGRRTRQTFQRFNYQPGKSQLVVMTGVLGNQPSGVSARIGYFDDRNGFYFENSGGVFSLVKRSYVSGSAVNTPVFNEDFNLRKVDSIKDSFQNSVDWDKTQIFFLDMEWLGVGTVRMGIFIDGVPIYLHAFHHANRLETVYISTPNLPVRYEIENDGTGAASSLDHICCSVASEGGLDDNGILRHQDSGLVSGLNNSSTYAFLGIRLKDTHLDVAVLLENISAVATSQSDKAHWELLFNPTVSGTFTFVDQPNSAVQIAAGDDTNLITDSGFEIDGGYFTDNTPVISTVPNALRLGSSIDGTRDIIVLSIKPLTNNITVDTSFTWRELV